MQLPRFCCRTNRLGICLGAFLALLVSGCGGGGEDSSQVPSHEGPNAGTGSLFISIPTNTGAFQTDLPTVRLEGGSFTPAGSNCNGFSGILPINFQVTWSNNSTGATGVARASLNCLVIVFTGWDSLYIPLRIGINSITVTASDGAGNIGRDTIVVTRTPPPPDLTPPTVIATNPANGATSMGTNSAITVTFSEVMDPASISSSTILLKDPLNNPVNGSVAYSNNVATFTAAASLQVSTVYTAIISTGVKDVAGNALETAHTWSFTTGSGSSTGLLAVSSTSPANGATCVPTDTVVFATFSEPVLPQSVNTTSFLLEHSLNFRIGGNVGLDNLGRAYFLPSGALANSSSYTATLTTGITDLSGNNLSADYSWTFTIETNVTGVCP